MNHADKYNGWTNYATWRVNLEMFDGFDPREFFTDANNKFDVNELVENLKGYADELLTANGENGIAVSYARAFLSDVNWHEIAKHLLDDRS